MLPLLVNFTTRLYLILLRFTYQTYIKIKSEVNNSFFLKKKKEWEKKGLDFGLITNECNEKYLNV